MRRVYNVFFAIFLAFSAPFYLWKMWRRGNWKARFLQRFGRYDSRIKQAVTNRQVLWFHAVSVGEVNICTQLIKAIEPRAPALTIVVSTTTSTGMAELERKLPAHVLKVYYPIDLKRWVQRAFAILHPKAVVLVEAEIWPNFLWRAKAQHVPVFLVNARLSERSFRGYRRFGRLFRPLFAGMAGVTCQNEEDRQRLIAVGCRPEVTRVVGNLKYDAARLPEQRLIDVPRLLAKLGVSADAPILVGGSTHRGEEAILADIFLRLRNHIPGLFLILVPRHHERGREVGKELSARGIRFVFRKDITPDVSWSPGEVEALLVNVTGELRFYYEYASAVFIGKSLTARGGQNPIEPALLAKPVVFGRNMDNFQAISKALMDGGGAITVNSPSDLEQALQRILSDRGFAEELGRNAQRVVKQNLGSIERTVDMIVQRLDDKGVYVVPDA